MGRQAGLVNQLADLRFGHNRRSVAVGCEQLEHLRVTPLEHLGKPAFADQPSLFAQLTPTLEGLRPRTRRPSAGSRVRIYVPRVAPAR